MAKLSVDTALLKAKSHAKKGEVEEAQKLYQAVLQAFPKNKRAQQGLAALNKPQPSTSTQIPPQDTINQLINLYNQGQLAAVVDQAQALTKQYPEVFAIWNILGAANKGLGRVQAASEAFKKVTELNSTYADGFNNLGATLQDQGKLEEAIASYNKALSLKPDLADAYYNMGVTLKDQGKLEEAIEAYNKALSLKPDYAKAYNNMGNALKDQGKLEEAIEAYNKALSLKPDYAEAYYNMGNALKDQGKLDEAIASYNKALSLKPDYADAYNNMGIALQDQGKLDEAIASYNKALSLNPDDAEAYNNMGNALKDQGKLDEAIASFNKTLALKPDYAEVKNNLILILKIFSPEKNHAHQLIDIDNEIKVKHNENALPTADQELAIFTLDLLNRLQSVDRDVSTELSQIYRRNKVDLNCRRHFAIFKEKEIIPQFCFRCYKVQVELPTVLDLIRLSALFYEIEFESDLIRKCLVEVRPNIPGSYKGLIYCRGIDQANSVKKQLDVHVSAIDKNLTAKIKKGCSEFPLAFPKYGEVAANEEDAMQYPQEWHTLETRFDDENLILPESYVYPSLKGFCLSDYLIIQKWIDYAKGIGDPTSKLFCDLPIKYKEIWKIAQARIKQ